MWQIAGKTLNSRLFLGSARYPSPSVLSECIKTSATDVVTVALRRETATSATGSFFWQQLKNLPVHILPNTAGCHTAKEAVTTAHMARDLFATNWIKLEVIGDDYSLQPDPFGLVEAAEVLCKEGFEVFPYTTDDLIVAERLLQAGCRILMPWGSPIGSGRGLANPLALRALRHRYPHIPMIIDAGLGKPSHAAQAMEMGFDAVLLNSAVACAHDPVMMASAFRLGVKAGREAFESGAIPERDGATPSTSLIDRPFQE